MLHYHFRDISDVSDEEVLEVKNLIASHFADNVNLKKRESVLSKAVLCHMIENIYGTEEYFIEADENGKLFSTDKAFCFNISHSKNMIFCTVAKENVGCDVEIISEFKANVAKRFFTEKEYEMLTKSEKSDEDFIRLWTVKESILKYSGKGISGGLSTYDFSDCIDKDTFSKYGLNFVTFIKGKYVFSFCTKERENCLYQLKIGGDKNADFKIY